jgi:membrane protease YdiL (CAAX protease family)
MNDHKIRGSALDLWTCPWTLKDVFIVLVYAIVLFFVFSFGLSILNSLVHCVAGVSFNLSEIFKPFEQGIGNFYSVIIFYIALFVAMKLKIFKKYGISPLNFFVRKTLIARDIRYGLRIYLKFVASLTLVVVLAFCVAAIWDMIFNSKLLENANVFFIASRVEKMGAEDRASGVIGVIILFAIAPFFEELFFRGCLYRALRSRFSRSFAILISSFVFSLLHGYFFLFFYVFLVGWLLAVMYEKTQSLVAPLAFHMVNNLVVILFLLLKF